MARRSAGTGGRAPTASPPGARPAAPCRSGPAPARPPWRPSAGAATTTDAPRCGRATGSEVECGGVAGLVQADGAPAGQPDAGQPAPALIADRFGKGDAPGAQFGDGLVDVVAHE